MEYSIFDSKYNVFNNIIFLIGEILSIIFDIFPFVFILHYELICRSFFNSSILISYFSPILINLSSTLIFVKIKFAKFKLSL